MIYTTRPSLVCIWHPTYKTMKATRTRRSWVHLFITHRHTLTLQLHNFDLFRTCRTSSFCTVAWQLARFQLTRRIARSHGDSWASCPSFWWHWIIESWPGSSAAGRYRSISAGLRQTSYMSRPPSIDGTDRQTDGQRDSVPLHNRLPEKRPTSINDWLIVSLTD